MKVCEVIRRLCKHKIYICICMACLFAQGQATAQFRTFFQPRDSIERYVSVMMHLSPPYRKSLAEYADTRADQFMIRMALNDLSMCYEQVMVEITLESMDIVWKSDVRVFSFSGKWMLQLNGADFVPFFASANMPQNISKTGMLHLPSGTDPHLIPDGLYRIGLEINGFGTQMRPTKVYTPYYPFFLDNPPKLQIPKNKGIVLRDSLQNIRFEWKPRHLHSENMDEHVKVTYHLELYASNMENNIPVWTCSTTSNSYTLTAKEYLLQPGMKYTWRIRVTTDHPDETYFYNDGYSDVFVFEYR